MVSAPQMDFYKSVVSVMGKGLIIITFWFQKMGFIAVFLVGRSYRR